jgi:hypothetical protein
MMECKCAKKTFRHYHKNGNFVFTKIFVFEKLFAKSFEQLRFCNGYWSISVFAKINLIFTQIDSSVMYNVFLQKSVKVFMSCKKFCFVHTLATNLAL